MIKRIPILLSLGLFSVTGCYYDVEEDLYPKEPACITTGITYNVQLKQILNTNCAISGCHVSGTDIQDLSNYSGVKQMADKGLIYQKVIVEKTMPPMKPLPDCELNQIKAWLEAGAPEN